MGIKEWFLIFFNISTFAFIYKLLPTNKRYYCINKNLQNGQQFFHTSKRNYFL
jgi:hypothetical protein